MKKIIDRVTVELKAFEEKTKLFTTIQSFKIPFTLPTLKKLVWALALGALIYLLLASVVSKSYAISASGGLTWGLLIFTIFVSLVNKILPRLRIASQLLPLRKESGVFAFGFGLLHAFFFIWKINGWGDIPLHMFSSFDLTMGSLALLIMIPLFLTSTAWAIRTIGFKSWKLLHKLTHLVFIFSALHIAFKLEELEGGPILLLLVYTGLMGYVWRKKKQK